MSRKLHHPKSQRKTFPYGNLRPIRSHLHRRPDWSSPQATATIKYKNETSLAAIAAGMTLAATAEAREANPPAWKCQFEDLDINSDGAATSDEIEAAMQASCRCAFAETDTNGDGALSVEELIARADTARQDRAAGAAEQIERARPTAWPL
jgi:hypothetical protein